MDDADLAAALEERHRTAALAAHRSRRTAAHPAALTCSDCGEPIPEGRRKAVPGTHYCVECA